MFFAEVQGSGVVDADPFDIPGQISTGCQGLEQGRGQARVGNQDGLGAGVGKLISKSPVSLSLTVSIRPSGRRTRADASKRELGGVRVHD